MPSEAKQERFIDKLDARAHQARSLLCVGLDPHPEFLPQPTAQAARAFCLRLIEQTAPYACAFKPNSAFFEALGAEGFDALRQVIAAVPDDIPVILDAKRGDIASTARAYARAAFEVLGADALTLSPYLGRDAVEPFLRDPGRGAFLLCRTSNPGGADLQELHLPGHGPLYLVVARLVESWDASGNLGLVVGATRPDALAEVRAITPQRWILAPGVGAQGGDLGEALAAGRREDGLGLLISVSRSLARAHDPAAEARRLQQAIAAAPPPTKAPLEPALARLADDLLEVGAVRFGNFRLKSGKQSPIYFDLRLLSSYPRLLNRAAAAYLPILRELEYDHLAAVPYAALPIGTALALMTGKSMIYPRKEIKDYGTRAAVEGHFSAGEWAVVVDDLATTGGSKLEAVERLTAAGLQVEHVVVLIDRQSGAARQLLQHGLRLHAALYLEQLLDHWQAVGKLEADKVHAVRQFLAAEREADGA